MSIKNSKYYLWKFPNVYPEFEYVEMGHSYKELITGVKPHQDMTVIEMYEKLNPNEKNRAVPRTEEYTSRVLNGGI